ncbi:hypothetical protein [Paraburkholderia sp. SIMBA_054]|uniref:hypothetical protein n=1 Tax=Paraburkholderia sp. SIMBA_054 TaxID=3085795 RepID=UPI00397B3CA0
MMATTQFAQGALVDAIALLMKRRANTTDAAEKDQISVSIGTLDGLLQDMDQASLLDAANDVTSATVELEKVVGSARLGPFDTYLADIQNILQRLQTTLGQMHASEALPPAPDVPQASVHADVVQAAAPAAVPGAPGKSTAFADLKAEYEAYFNACLPNDDRKANVQHYISQLTRFKDVYKSVGDGLGIPWCFVGIVHGLECGFNFNEHLHNGDPLTARTVHVPAGRPAAGAPPFTWRESAIDAMVFEHYANEADWSIPRILYRFERYNGMGYRALGVPTPYLWSFSNLYKQGKFSSDGHFDATAISQQCGAGVMLKVLQTNGLL